MTKWAVGLIDFHDNDLTIEIVEANTWQEALTKHTKNGGYEITEETLDEAKMAYFDQDAMIDVVEIPQ